jgi:ribosomal protein S6
MTDDGARKTSGRDVAAGRTLERVRSASATARGWIAKTRRRDARVGTTGRRPCGASCAVIARWVVTRAASLQWHCTAASSSAAMQLHAHDWRKHYFSPRRRHIDARGERATRRRRRPTDGRAPRPRLDAPRIASSAPRRIAAMVLYDMFIAVKSTVPRSQMADVLRKMGHRVLDAGGVITDITSFGTQTLAYQIRKQGQGHLEVRVVGSLGASNRRVARSRVVSARASRPNRIERPRFIVSREQNPTYVLSSPFDASLPPRAHPPPPRIPPRATRRRTTCRCRSTRSRR